MTELLYTRKTKTCKIQDCEKSIRGRGWCMMHWQRWRSNGDPMVVKNVVSEPIFMADGTPAHKSKLYGVWRAMLSRCSKPNDPGYADYGGRGIKVCDRWKTFKNFYDDMGEAPTGRSLDRISSDGDYNPDNCRWATLNLQSHNRRKYGKSPYRGITYRKQTKRWIASLTHNYKSMYLGSFQEPEDAAIAYDCAVLQVYGDDAYTNLVGVA